MDKIKIGILGTSEIAFRRFLPAVQKCDIIEYSGVASRNVAKTEKFIQEFGGTGYGSYDELINDSEIDAVYVPLPPALHFEWGKKVLESGKHLLMEKPFTTSIADTTALLELANQKNLAVHENYMFLYHPQLKYIKDCVNSGEIGELRLLRTSFCFPKRDSNDFRYNKELGGGALLDCGGYPIRLASYFLGDSTKVDASKLNFTNDFEVDLYGSATLSNDFGQIAQISFGMDNNYQCSLELLGSKGRLFTDRIFSAPDGFVPKIVKSVGMDQEEIVLEAADSFEDSIMVFVNMTQQRLSQEKNHEILLQGKIVERISAME